MRASTWRDDRDPRAHRAAFIFHRAIVDLEREGQRNCSAGQEPNFNLPNFQRMTLWDIAEWGYQNERRLRLERAAQRK